MMSFIVLAVLVVAPSGSFGMPLEAAPGSVGHHGNVQAGQRRFIDEPPVVYCAGCMGGDGENHSPVSVYSGSPLLNLPQINNNNNLNTNLQNNNNFHLQNSNLNTNLQNSNLNTNLQNSNLNTNLKNNNNLNSNNNNRGFAFANNPLIDRINLDSPVISSVSQSQNVVKGNQAPASAQYLNMNQDGQYNFGYTALDSSRQERRNPDGTVQGSYSYRNPAGRLVEIAYTAGPNSGFNAYGENIPPRQIAYTPIPVQDTPAVKAAREQFLNTYAQELNRINSAKAQEQQLLQQQQSQTQILQQTVQQQTDKMPLAHPMNSQNSQPLLPLSGIATDTQNQKPDTFDDEDDTEIVYAALANSYNNAQEQKENNNKATFYNENNKNTEFKPENLMSQENKDKVQSSYGFWTKETITPARQVPLPNTRTQNQQNQLPAYFYYVSVGGAPHYVTSNTNSLVKNNFPTSLRATLLGAVPIAAMHDAQVRHSGEKVQEKSSPPLYLDLESNKQEMNNMQAQMHNQQLLNPALLNTFSIVNVPNQAQGQSQVSSSSQANNNQQSPGGFNQVQLIGYPVFVV